MSKKSVKASGSAASPYGMAGRVHKVSIIAAFIITAGVLAGCATVTGDKFRQVNIEPYDHGQRFLAGVLSFYDSTNTPELSGPGSSFSGVMVGSLQEHGRYRLIEAERVQSLLEAQSFQMSGFVDSESAQEAGKLLGVEAVCITTIDRFDYLEERTTAFIAWIDTQKVELGVNSRIVSIATGEVLAAADTRVTRGRKKRVAFGFLKSGGFVEKETLINETMDLAIRNLAVQLSEKAPRK